MIYLSNDGRLIDTDNLLDLGLSGNPLSPTVEPTTINIPPIKPAANAEPVGQAVTPPAPSQPSVEPVVRPQPPEQQSQPAQQPATQPVAPPTPGTLAHLIQSPEFVQSNRDDQRAKLKEWHADAMGKIYTSPLSNAQKDQIGMALNVAIEKLYPALEHNTLADTWTSIKGGWTQGTGSGAGGLAFTFDKLGSKEWDKALLQYGLDKQQEAQKTFDTEYSAGARDDQRAAKARDEAANKAWNEAKGFFDSISAALDVGKAKLDNFLDAPVQSTMRTAASFGPQVAATTVGAGVGAVTGSLAGPAGAAVGANIGARTVGAAMSAGEAVGQQYQQNLDYLRQQNVAENKGWTEQQMQDMAAEAALKFGADDVLALTGGALAGQVAGKAVAPVTNMVTRGLSGAAASKTSSGIVSTLGRAAGDAVLEGADEVSTTIAGNMGTIDPNVKWSDDTAQAFFSGVGPGFGLGLVGNRPSGGTSTPPAQPTGQQPPAPPSPPTAVQPESPFPPTPPAPTVVDNGQPPAPPAPPAVDDTPNQPAPPAPEPEPVVEAEPVVEPVVEAEPAPEPVVEAEPAQEAPTEVYQAELDFGDTAETASDQPVDPEFETTTEDLDAIVTAPQVEASNGTDQPTTDVQRTQADTDGGSSSVPVTQPESTQGGDGPHEPPADATSAGVGTPVQSEVAVQQRQGTDQGQPVTAPATSDDTVTPTVGSITNEQPVNPEPASPTSSQSASQRSTATPTAGGTGGDGQQGVNSQRTQEPSQVNQAIAELDALQADYDEWMASTYTPAEEAFIKARSEYNATSPRARHGKAARALFDKFQAAADVVSPLNSIKAQKEQAIANATQRTLDAVRTARQQPVAEPVTQAEPTVSEPAVDEPTVESEQTQPAEEPATSTQTMPEPTGEPEVYTTEVAQAKVDKAQRAYDNAVTQVDRYQQLVDSAKARQAEAKQGSRAYRSAVNSLKTNEEHLSNAKQALADKAQLLANARRDLEASKENADKQAQEQAKKDQEYLEREQQRAEAKQAKRQENSEKYRQINAEQQAQKKARWQEEKAKRQAEQQEEPPKKNGAKKPTEKKKAEDTPSESVVTPNTSSPLGHLVSQFTTPSDGQTTKKNGAKKKKETPPPEPDKSQEVDTTTDEDLDENLDDDYIDEDEQAALQAELEAELAGEPAPVPKKKNGRKSDRQKVDDLKASMERLKTHQGKHGQTVLKAIQEDGTLPYTVDSEYEGTVTHIAPILKEGNITIHNKAIHPVVIRDAVAVGNPTQLAKLSGGEQKVTVGIRVLARLVAKATRTSARVSEANIAASLEKIARDDSHPFNETVHNAITEVLYNGNTDIGKQALSRSDGTDVDYKAFSENSFDELIDWVANVDHAFFRDYPVGVQSAIIGKLRSSKVSPTAYTSNRGVLSLVMQNPDAFDQLDPEDVEGEVLANIVAPEVIRIARARVDEKNTLDNLSSEEKKAIIRRAGVEYLMSPEHGALAAYKNMATVVQEVIRLAGITNWPNAYSAVQPALSAELDGVTFMQTEDVDNSVAAAVELLNKLARAIAINKGLDVPPAQASRAAQAPETGMTSVAAIRSALPADLRDTFDARLELGRNGERGGVVVVKSEADLPIGGQDITGEGGVIQGAYDKTTGITYLVQDNLTPAAVTGVYLHEAFHATDNPVMERRANDLLNSEVESDSELGQFMRDVEEAMAEAGVAGNVAEAGPYMIELAARRGRVHGFSAVDGKFMSWLDSWAPSVIPNMIRNAVARMRAWKLAHGADFTPTVDDLVAYARRAAKRQAGTVIPPAVQGTINKAVAMVQRGSTKPTVTHSDFNRIAQGKAPERHKHTLSSAISSISRFIGRKFIDRLGPLKAVNQELHTLLEGGETLRNELLSGIYRGYMVPFHKASATAAEQLRKLARQGKIDASYRHIDAADVQRMAGHYAVWKYAAQANLARATFWRSVLDRDIPRAIDEILADHPELAAWGRERLSEFTETEKAALKKLLGDREFEDTVAMATLQEAILPKLKSKKATQARHELSRITIRRGELRDQLSIFEAMDGQVIEDDEDGSATDKLREGRYKPIGGYTTATATKLVNEFEARPEFAVIKDTYDRMMDIRRHVTELADAYGVYSDEDRAARDGLDTYVPTTGDPDKLMQQNDAERHADLRDEWYNAQENEMSYGIGMNNRNLYRERQGRTTVPDSADKAIVDQMYLTVNQIAYKAFKDEAVAVGLDAVDPALANKLRDGTLTGTELSQAVRKSGMTVETTAAEPEVPDTALALNPTEDVTEAETEDAPEESAPVVATADPDVIVFGDTDTKQSDENTIRHMVNVRDAEGNTYRIKVGFKFANRQVSEAIRSGAVPSAGPLKVMNAVTRFMSSLITVKDYTFAMKALVQDVSERTGILSSRHDLKDANGNPVDLHYVRDIGNVLKFIRTRLAFATPTQRANNAVWQAAFHKVYLDNEDGRFLKEMAMHYKGSGLSTQAGIVSNAVNSRTPMANRYNTKTKRAIAEVSDALTGWAEFMGMQVSFALYRMLRERGVSVADATEAIRNTMPYGRRGEWTNSLRPLFFFLNPSLQGANLTAKSLLADYTNFNRAMKTGAPIRLAIKVASKAHTVVMLNMVASFLWSAISGMLAGSDDEDDIVGNHYERMPISTRMRNIMVPLPGGGFANVPQGYGLPGIGWGAGQILYSSMFGKMDAKDAGDEMSKLLVKELSGLPLSDVSVKEDPVGFITRTMIPSAFSGFIDAYSGKNRFGHNINKEFISKDLPRYMQGKANTPEFYKGLAEMISPVMDLTPEQTRALISGIFPGIFDRVVRSTDKMDEHPVYGALGAVGLSRFMTPESRPNAINAAYYSERSKAEVLYRQLNARIPYLLKETEPISSIYGRALRAGFTADEATLMAMNVAIKRKMRSASDEQDEFLKTQFLRSIPR